MDCVGCSMVLLYVTGDLLCNDTRLPEKDHIKLNIYTSLLLHKVMDCVGYSMVLLYVTGDLLCNDTRLPGKDHIKHNIYTSLLLSS